MLSDIAGEVLRKVDERSSKSAAESGLCVVVQFCYKSTNGILPQPLSTLILRKTNSGVASYVVQAVGPHDLDVATGKLNGTSSNDDIAVFSTLNSTIEYAVLKVRSICMHREDTEICTVRLCSKNDKFCPMSYRWHKGELLRIEAAIGKPGDHINVQYPCGETLESALKRMFKVLDNCVFARAPGHVYIGP